VSHPSSELSGSGSVSQRRLRLGRRGERKATRFLRRQGLRVLERNWRCPGGELDVLAREGDTLVVVEVRTSRAGFAGGPAYTVGPEKRRRLERLTRRWLLRSRWTPDSVRFDVVSVERHAWWSWQISWIQSAFETRDP
jgi:putative endonuclease